MLTKISKSSISFTAIFLLRLDKKISKKDFPEQLERLAGVASVEILSC